MNHLDQVSEVEKQLAEKQISEAKVMTTTRREKIKQREQRITELDELCDGNHTEFVECDVCLERQQLMYSRERYCGSEINLLLTALEEAERDAKLMVCCYCGKVREKPQPFNRETMTSEVLQHLEDCPTHPFNELVKVKQALEEADSKLREFYRTLVGSAADGADFDTMVQYLYNAWHAIKIDREEAEQRERWIEVTPETMPEYGRHIWVFAYGMARQAELCEGFNHDHDHFDTAPYCSDENELLVIPKQKASHWQYFVIPGKPLSAPPEKK